MYEFDLKTLLRTFAAKRRLLCKAALIALVVGLVVAFSIPKVYLSSVSLAAESQETGGMGNMKALASMMGSNFPEGSDAIGPDLYPDVVSTNDFIVALLDVPVVSSETARRQTFLEYLQTESRVPWWTAAVRGTIRGVKSLLPAAKKKKKPFSGKIDPQRLSADEEDVVKGLKSMVSCSVDDGTGVITLSVRAQDAGVAQQMVDTATAHLQDFITLYRTNKARTDLQYYLTLEKEAADKYTECQQRYAAYCDTHQDIQLQSYIVQRERLENELQLAFNTYSQIKQQREMAEAKVQERTPAFTILQKSSVPNRHESPRKMFVLLGYLFVALVGTSLWIYFSLLLGRYRETAPTGRKAGATEAETAQP